MEKRTRKIPLKKIVNTEILHPTFDVNCSYQRVLARIKTILQAITNCKLFIKLQSCNAQS